jgi:hypothetical protein
VSGDGELRGDEERERLRSTSRYSVYVGIAFLIVIAVTTYTTFQGEERAVLGADDTVAGEPLTEFALPELVGGPEGDANIFQDDCESSANPCPEDERRTPACQVEGPGVIRVCDLFDRPLVLSFWFPTPAECPPTQDAIDDAARRWGDRVNFLSVAVRGDRAELGGIVAERGWRLPVGWDRDGAVSNLYRVGVCPTVAFALEGGIMSQAKVGAEELGADQLDRAIARIVRESRRRAETSR